MLRKYLLLSLIPLLLTVPTSVFAEEYFDEANDLSGRMWQEKWISECTDYFLVKVYGKEPIQVFLDDKEMIDPNGYNQYQIDVRSIEEGEHFVKIQSDGNIVTKNYVIMKGGYLYSDEERMDCYENKILFDWKHRNFYWGGNWNFDENIARNVGIKGASNMIGGGQSRIGALDTSLQNEFLEIMKELKNYPPDVFKKIDSIEEKFLILNSQAIEDSYKQLKFKIETNDLTDNEKIILLSKLQDKYNEIIEKKELDQLGAPKFFQWFRSFVSVIGVPADESISQSVGFSDLTANEEQVMDAEPILDPEPVVEKMNQPICGAGTLLQDGICVIDKSQATESKSRGGGCLIATATFDSELAPQVQQLREIRDSKLLNTESGTNFMNTFNDVYYSFSPIIADYERENPYFKEMVKVAITPMLSTLSLMEYAESESEVLGIGIGVILLNLGMYLGVPVFAIMRFRRS